MNNQEIFDKVAAHLLTQNKVCTIGTSCSYRNKDGLQCAAGCLIPDDVYGLDFERKGWTELIESFPHNKFFSQFTPENNYFISSLQDIHDASDVSDWKIKLEELALKNNLKTEILNQF